MSFRSAALSIALSAGILASASVASADMSADEQKIRELEQKWVAAVRARDAAASAAFYAEDGALLAADAPIAKGGPAVLAAWQGLMGMKNISLTFAPSEIVVSQSGDMAYDIGTYALGFDGDCGPVKDVGKYVVVWNKVGADWKLAAESFNSDGPPKWASAGAWLRAYSNRIVLP